MSEINITQEEILNYIDKIFEEYYQNLPELNKANDIYQNNMNPSIEDKVFLESN